MNCNIEPKIINLIIKSNNINPNIIPNIINPHLINHKYYTPKCYKRYNTHINKCVSYMLISVY